MQTLAHLSIRAKDACYVGVLLPEAYIFVTIGAAGLAQQILRPYEAAIGVD